VDVIRAAWKNGRIVPDGPVDWPEGCRLVVEPEVVDCGAIEERQEVWSNSPEAISDWWTWGILRLKNNKSRAVFAVKQSSGCNAPSDRSGAQL
jgi:hypothetical protein